jgi:F0F1-type ATP synthase delta subunit
MSAESHSYSLPPTLINKVDFAHMINEIEVIDAALEAQKVRGYKKEQYTLPAISRTLTDFLELNKVDILDDHIRMTFKAEARKLKDKVPVVHLTFASAADPESLEYLVGWIRQELHPLAVLSVGLQPSLIGGTYIRTPNHVHDYSMRALFKGKTSVLVNDLARFDSAR